MSCHYGRIPFQPKHTLAALVALSISAASWAEPALEEVIVTAQKRSESLQSVPISVAAVSGIKLDEAGVENIENLTSLVPNIHLTQTGVGTQLRVRGIGSDNSQGFEQSVGVYKNDVYFSRAQLLRAPIFDMERVEVLRGPQGTLFGKNSIAGALDLITARPTDTATASLDGSYETEFGTKEMTGIVSGPLTDTLKGRLALRWYDDPGYFHNSINNQDEANQRETAGRVSLDWQPIHELLVKYTGEKDNFDVKGRNIEMVVDQPNAKGINYSGLAKLIGEKSFESSHDYVRQSDAPEASDNQVSSHTLAIDYSMPSVTLSSVTGLVKYDYSENCDCDFSPLNIFQLALAEDYKQVSQEIRLASNAESVVTWLGGLFYQAYDQNFQDVFSIPANSTLFAAAKLQGSTLPAAFGNTGIHRNFSQSSDSWAIFGQLDWHFTDKATVVIGGRYTEESKDGTKAINMTNIDGSAITNAQQKVVAANIYKQRFKTDTIQAGSVPKLNFATGMPVMDPVTGMPVILEPKGHDLNQSRDESAFTPSLKLQYQVADDTMTYVSYSKGFKAGGFDPRSNDNDRFEFEDEKADAYEAGLKTSLNDGKVELNLAFYRTDYSNLQISQFDGAVGFNVGNAKDTLVQGLELDGRWAATEHITANYGLSLLDFEYKDFKNGNCNKAQIDANAGTDTDADGKADMCDYTGKRGVYTPKYTANAGFDYKRPIGSLNFTTTLDLQWVDSQQVHPNLDPNGEIDAYTLLGLRFALAGEHWQVALAGNNLLDEYVTSYMSNAPLSDTTFSTETIYGFARRPRTYTLSAGVKF